MIESVTLKNTKTKDSVTLNKDVGNPYILDSVDFGQIQANHVSSKYYQQVGETETFTSLGTRSFTLIGYATGDTTYAMETKKNFLNEFVNPLQPIEVSVPRFDGTEFTINVSPDSSVAYGTSEEENNEVFCKFSITGVCFDPLFQSKEINQVLMAQVLPKFRFPLHLPTIMGIKQVSLTKVATNIGATSTGMKIHFHALDTVLNPKLINVMTQDTLAINKTLTTNEEVVIDTNIGSKSVIGINGGIESDYFEYLDLDSVWLQLAIGDNVFRYDADYGLDKLEVILEFYTKLLEVQ